MFRKMTAVTTALAISIMLAACGGDKDPARTEPPGARAAPAAEAGTDTNARTPGQGEIPAPTRPQRLNISPTEEPSGAGGTAETGTTPAGSPGGERRETPKTGKAPATAEPAPAEPVPPRNPDWPPPHRPPLRRPSCPRPRRGRRGPGPETRPRRA